jgi:hypothetical protein
MEHPKQRNGKNGEQERRGPDRIPQEKHNLNEEIP